MREFEQNKLWRDKSVDSVEKNGSILNWRRLNDAEFDKKLREKLVEEANEVALAEARQELVEELADVLEVLDNFTSLHGITDEEISKVQETKRHVRGGFFERKYVETAKHLPGSKEEAYCLMNPQRYPEKKAESFRSGSPRVAARAVIRCQDDILLLRDISYPEENLSLPGGAIEFTESADKALMRELLEELGASLPVGRFLGCFEQHFEHLRLGDIHDISFIFLVEAGDKEKALISSQEERYECVWLPLKELAGSKLLPTKLRSLIPKWLSIDVNAALEGCFLEG